MARAKGGEGDVHEEPREAGHPPCFVSCPRVERRASRSLISASAGELGSFPSPSPSRLAPAFFSS